MDAVLPDQALDAGAGLVVTNELSGSLDTQTALLLGRCRQGSRLNRKAPAGLATAPLGRGSGDQSLRVLLLAPPFAHGPERLGLGPQAATLARGPHPHRQRRLPDIEPGDSIEHHLDGLGDLCAGDRPMCHGNNRHSRGPRTVLISGLPAPESNDVAERHPSFSLPRPNDQERYPCSGGWTLRRSEAVGRRGGSDSATPPPRLQGHRRRPAGSRATTRRGLPTAAQRRGAGE